jgi:hypothetical protein
VAVAVRAISRRSGRTGLRLRLRPEDVLSLVEIRYGMVDAANLLRPLW